MRWPQFTDRQLTSPWIALASADTAGAAAIPVSHFPLPGWPAQSTVEYFTKLIVLGLLLLALPYLIGTLIVKPGAVLEGRAGAVIAKA
jgi:hypothetical protein